MLNGLVKSMDIPTRNTLAHLSRRGFHPLKNESDAPRQVCLPRTARAVLANYLSIIVFSDNQYLFSSAAAQSEAEETIPKRLKSLLFNETDAAVLQVPAIAEFGERRASSGHTAILTCGRLVAQPPRAQPPRPKHSLSLYSHHAAELPRSRRAAVSPCEFGERPPTNAAAAAAFIATRPSRRTAASPRIPRARASCRLAMRP
jgi:hypothetical protein